MGFQGEPFAEDYFARGKVECNWKAKAPMGVCPDSFLGGDNADLNNIQLVWGQRVDGKADILGFRE